MAEIFVNGLEEKLTPISFEASWDDWLCAVTGRIQDEIVVKYKLYIDFSKVDEEKKHEEI